MGLFTEGQRKMRLRPKSTKNRVSKVCLIVNLLVKFEISGTKFLDRPRRNIFTSWKLECQILLLHLFWLSGSKKGTFYRRWRQAILNRSINYMMITKEVVPVVISWTKILIFDGIRLFYIKII